MRALILGAGGQVGRALAATAPAGAEVIALARADCDLSDAEAIRRAVAGAAAEIVLNAAAYTAVDKAESEPELAATINGKAAGWVAAAARSAGARTVHISTDFVFDGNGSRPYRPDDPVGPLSVYGRSKLEGEHAVTAGDPDALIVRTAWVYAAAGANFVNTMLRLMRERDTLGIVADQIGTPTHAASLARAIWTLVASGATGIYHYTDAGVASWYDFAVAIEEEARSIGLLDRSVRVEPIATADYPTPARRPAYSVLDKSATWAAIGGAAPHWRVELRAMLRELKQSD
jgi:dTDP-4-dehydrorhamnose reductase